MTKFPFGLSSYGFPLIGSGPFITTGKVFFVHYGTGTDGTGRGDAPDRPFKTSDYAVDQCTANKGDMIFLMPGHAEDITAAGTVTVDKAGVSIIGLGNGRLRPTFSYKTVTTATFLISAANVWVHNVVHSLIGIDALATALNITGDDVTISDNEFVMCDATNKAVAAITVGSAADRVTILNCLFDANAAAGATAAIFGAAACDRLTVKGCMFDGDFATAAINNTTAAWTRVNLEGNRYRGTNASEPIIELVASATGLIAHNLTAVATLAAGGSITAAGAMPFQNYATDTAASSGILDPTGVTL